MKKIINKRSAIIGALITLIVVLVVAVSVGCAANKDDYTVSAKNELNNKDTYYINTKEDIYNLVTDDDKLVINYYDAYTWAVIFDDDGVVDEMVYIYKFEDESAAQDMVSVRKGELEKNRTMTIRSCRALSEFVVVELTDTSFSDVSRDILENNFDGLIVY